jgi:hypothetical protein
MGRLLGCNWLHSGWTKSLVCKDAFNRDFTIQSTFRRFCTACKSEEFWFPVSRPDDVSSLPDAYMSTIPSVRTTCHIIRTPTDQASSVWTTCISVRTLLCIEKLLFQLSSVRTTQQPVRTTSSDRSASDFLSKIIYGKIAATVRTAWIPVWTCFSLRQESQFKFNCPDFCLHGPDSRASYMEIVDLTSTVRTPAYHGPDAR